MQTRAKVLVGGSATGPLLPLAQPISFWGGIDPTSGRVIDPRHPNHGQEIGGRVLAIPAVIGSSSSSAVMLELIKNGTAPAGILLGQNDTILPLGVLIARELGYATIPIVEIDLSTFQALPGSGDVQIDEDGTIRL